MNTVVLWMIFLAGIQSCSPSHAKSPAAAACKEVARYYPAREQVAPSRAGALPRRICDSGDKQIGDVCERKTQTTSR